MKAITLILTAFVSISFMELACAADKTSAPGTTFKDCADCPTMVVVPPGTFMMGSTKEEEERVGISPQRPGPDGKMPPPRSQSAIDEQLGWSLPMHRVTIATPFAVGQTHITHAQFAAFVADTHRPDPVGPVSCSLMQPYGNFDFGHKAATGNWHNTGYKQSDDDPVTCTAWEDATAYVKWLSQKTGKPYRLLSEAEYEYAARAGTTTENFWGNKLEDACKYANVADQTTHKIYPDLPWINCNDGYAYTAPDIKFQPNAFGLYGMVGNGYNWIADCWVPNYVGAPTDGSPRKDGDCNLHPERGGAWFTSEYAIRSAKRGRGSNTSRAGDNSFRIARDL